MRSWLSPPQEVELKGGVLEPELEIETIRQLRRAFGPTVPLRIDPNCAWTVSTSVHVGRSLVEELSGGGCLEDPAPRMDGMAEVRRRLMAEGISTPSASNLSFPIPTTGVASATSSGSPPSAAFSAWASPCTPTTTSASA